VGQATNVNTIFFAVAGATYCLLQREAEPTFALVAVRPEGDTIIACDHSDGLAGAVAKLLAAAN
jgi:hypothetical protein